MKARLETLLPLAVTGIGLLAALLYLPRTLFVDEYDHWPQAQVFARGGWTVASNLATWPTMNAVVGWLTAVIGQSNNLVAGRAVIAAFGLLAVVAFYRLASEFDATTAGLRSAQFFLSPIVLPFCVLVYTDVPALTCLLWAAVGAMRRDALLMLACVGAACAFRQNDIVWLPALFFLYWWICRQRDQRIPVASVIGFAGIGSAWLLAVWLRGGVASGVDSRSLHPGHLKGLSNVWFALFMGGLIYAPYFVARLWAERRLPIPLIRWMVFAVIVGLTFEAAHPFNLINTDYFLRNAVLKWITTQGGLAVAAPIMVVIGVLVWRTPLSKHPEILRPFLLAAVIALLPFWLIEQRYYLPIFALFWAMRAPVGRVAELSQLLAGAASTAWMLAQIAEHQHFI